jgi:hypothetical protein
MNHENVKQSKVQRDQISDTADARVKIQRDGGCNKTFSINVVERLRNNRRESIQKGQQYKPLGNLDGQI